MTTHRSEKKKTQWAPSMCLPTSYGARKPTLAGAFSYFDGKNAGRAIYALALTKRAAAKVNNDLGLLAAEQATIIQTADEVLAGSIRTSFRWLSGKTGSGTQSNMNMNEVLANRASELLGGARGMNVDSPNDDVQQPDSNDVFPTAMRIAAMIALRKLIPQLNVLKQT